MPPCSSLADSRLPAIDQNTAMFHNRQVVNDHYTRMAFGDEGARCAALLTDPKVKVMIMGNPGVLVIGDSVADTFNRLYYFERSAEPYIRALQTGRPLRFLSEAVAEKTARAWEDCPTGADAHLSELKALLDAAGSNHAS